MLSVARNMETAFDGNDQLEFLTTKNSQTLWYHFL